MRFTLQDPTIEGPVGLDSIAAASEGANRGGGFFAFATSSGIAALLQAAELSEFLAQDEASFELIVGSDAITNEKALEELVSWDQQFDSFIPRVFINEKGLFHPKFVWFENDEKLELVVGSGNLTLGGIGGNFEASLAVTLWGAEAGGVTAEIENWQDRWSDSLVSPDSDRARERVKGNSGNEQWIRRSRVSEEENEPEIPDPIQGAMVLLMEIPRNAPGRIQLDFGKTYFLEFFGGVEGVERTIRVQQVSEDGQLNPIEPPRKLIETKSINFRFELGAGRDFEYPSQGRPIVAFVRMSDGVFRYLLLLPDDVGHQELSAFLRENTEVVRSTQILRGTFSMDQIAASWGGIQRLDVNP